MGLMTGSRDDKKETLSLPVFLGLGWLLLAPFLAGAALAQEDPLQFSGSVKSYFYLAGSTPLGGGGGFLWDSPLRARLFYKPDGVFSLEAAEEITSQFQSGSGPGTAAVLQPPPSSYRLLDFSNPAAGPSSGNGERLIQNLDRLWAGFHWGRLEVDLGRQVVSFGSARVVNPTDVLAPFNIQNPDQENRSGVDALRVRYAWSELGELDTGWVAGKDARWENSAVFMRPRFHWAGLDVAILGMVFRENLMAGFDLQGSLGGAGIWAEGAWVAPPSPGTPYLRVSIGSDYHFNDEFYGFIEYHFNGAGQEDAASYLTPSHPTAYEFGGVYLLGRHYLAPSLSWQADPLLSFQGQVLANLGDGSLWISVSGEYNLVENLYLDFGIAQPLGSGLAGLLPSSEFGLYPSYQYLSGKAYF